MIDLPVVQAMQGGQAESLPVEGDLAPLFAEILAFVSSNPGPALDGLDHPNPAGASSADDTPDAMNLEQDVSPAPLLFLPTAPDASGQQTEASDRSTPTLGEAIPPPQAERGLLVQQLETPQTQPDQAAIPTPAASSVVTPSPNGMVSIAETAIGQTVPDAPEAPTPTTTAPVSSLSSVTSAVAVEPTTLPANTSVKAVSLPPTARATATPTVQTTDAAQPTAPTVASPIVHEAMAGNGATLDTGKSEGLPTPAADRVDNVPETSDSATSTAPSLTESSGGGRIARPDPPALVQRIDRWLSTRPTTPNSLVLEFGESGDFRVTVALRAAGLHITVAGAGTEDIPWIQELSTTLENRGLDAEVSSDAESGRRGDSDTEDDQPNWNPPPLSKQTTREQGLRL